MENEVKISRKLEEVAKEVGASSIQAVAIAYVMHKTPYVFPIIGIRKTEQLKGAIQALDVKLSPAQITVLESVLPFDTGFPHNFIGNGIGNNAFVVTAGHADPWMPMPALPESFADKE
ncbi:hypothetical protein Clacol_007785 [Clathrus columnatus]|uniref:NADP-dependent oxidoreductase domain-containing protein n=1 Tax=Clathrus columnatus TaxID=1419009 RepID=A0AAV5AFW1_9AGAM|nr:hypothetical protein Clacol_007785 [Clathrus columnatus]